MAKGPRSGGNKGKKPARPNKRQLSPDSPDDDDIVNIVPRRGYTCTCFSRNGASSCSHSSPVPSSHLPPPKKSSTKRSPASKRRLAKSATKSKAARKLDMNTNFRSVPRFLWAAFGKVRAPLKRLLRKRNCGQNGRRDLPWSRARCVASLFGIAWFDLVMDAESNDELSRLLREVVSPRPNRRARRSLASLGGGANRSLQNIPEENEDISSPAIVNDIQYENENPLDDLDNGGDVAPADVDENHNQIIPEEGGDHEMRNVDENDNDIRYENENHADEGEDNDIVSDIEAERDYTEQFPVVHPAYVDYEPVIPSELGQNDNRNVERPQQPTNNNVIVPVVALLPIIALPEPPAPAPQEIVIGAPEVAPWPRPGRARRRLF